MSIFHQNEKRDLEAAVKFYCQRGHDGHRAEEDVLATIDVLRAQLDKYREVLPTGMHELDEYCRGRKPDWVQMPGGPTVGRGQRTFLVGDADKSILSIQKITFSNGSTRVDG